MPTYLLPTTLVSAVLLFALRSLTAADAVTGLLYGRQSWRADAPLL
jgi:hypothetical protein